MSTVEYNFETSGYQVPLGSSSQEPANSHDHSASPPLCSQRQPAETNSRSRYHRLEEVCRQQGATIRALTRKMNLSTNEIRQQLDPHTDLKVSELLRWQEVLEVPLVDLLVDDSGPLSEPVSHRAAMLRIMKTAKALLEGTHERSTKRLSEMLVNQITEVMPELADVSAWHTVGQRRTQQELGRIVERSIPDNFFSEGL